MAHELGTELAVPGSANEVETGNTHDSHRTGEHASGYNAMHAHHQMESGPRNHGRQMHSQSRFSEEFRLAFNATLHCLLGCGIGEVAGMIIATALGMGMVTSMILAVVLGFLAGIALGILPLLKAGFSLRNAFKTVIIAEGLSIVVMEAFEVWIQTSIPGVMEAGLTDGIFWVGMLLGLIAGFIAALPVNYVMVKRGIRHKH